MKLDSLLKIFSKDSKVQAKTQTTFVGKESSEPIKFFEFESGNLDSFQHNENEYTDDIWNAENTPLNSDNPFISYVSELEGGCYSASGSSKTETANPSPVSIPSVDIPDFAISVFENSKENLEQLKDVKITVNGIETNLYEYFSKEMISVSDDNNPAKIDADAINYLKQINPEILGLFDTKAIVDVLCQNPDGTSKIDNSLLADNIKLLNSSSIEELSQLAIRGGQTDDVCYKNSTNLLLNGSASTALKNIELLKSIPLQGSEYQNLYERLLPQAGILIFLVNCELKPENISILNSINPQALKKINFNTTYAILSGISGDGQSVDYDKVNEKIQFLNDIYATNSNNSDISPDFISDPKFDIEMVTDFLNLAKEVKTISPEGKEASLYDDIISNKYNIFNKIADNMGEIDVLKERMQGLKELSDKYPEESGKFVNAGLLLINKPSELVASTIESLIRTGDLDKYARENDNSNLFLLFDNMPDEASRIPSYMDKMSKLMDYRTPDGKNIINSRNVAYFLNFDSDSNSARTVNRMLYLAQNGMINTSLLKSMYEEGDVSEEVKNDVDKLYEASIKGINPIDVFVPVVDTVGSGVSKVESGDVFSVEGENNIYIKTGEGTSQQLKMDRETYYKLFPPVDRFGTSQDIIGNCWEITGINAALAEPETRAKVLSMFTQNGDDITVKYPNGQLEVLFKNGVLPESANPDFYSDGALGVAMLENADGLEMQEKSISSCIDDIAKDNNPLTNVEDFTEFIKNTNPDDIWIQIYNGQVEYGTYDEAVAKGAYDGKYNNYATYLRDGGIINDIWSLMGFGNARDIRSQEEYKKLLLDPDTFEEYIVGFGTKGDEDIDALDSDKSIYERHAYRIEPVINENGEITAYSCINPWGVLESELTLDEVMAYSSLLSVAKK